MILQWKMTILLLTNDDSSIEIRTTARLLCRLAHAYLMLKANLGIWLLSLRSR